MLPILQAPLAQFRCGLWASGRLRRTRCLATCQRQCSRRVLTPSVAKHRQWPSVPPSAVPRWVPVPRRVLWKEWPRRQLSPGGTRWYWKEWQRSQWHRQLSPGGSCPQVALSVVPRLLPRRHLPGGIPRWHPQVAPRQLSPGGPPRQLSPGGKLSPGGIRYPQAASPPGAPRQLSPGGTPSEAPRQLSPGGIPQAASPGGTRRQLSPSVATRRQLSPSVVRCPRQLSVSCPLSRRQVASWKEWPRSQLSPGGILERVAAPSVVPRWQLSPGGIPRWHCQLSPGGSPMWRRHRAETVGPDGSDWRGC